MTDYYDMAIRHPRKVAALIAELQAENNDLNHEINVKAEWNMKYYERIDKLQAEVAAVQGRNEDLEQCFLDMDIEPPRPRPPECRHNRVEKLLEERVELVTKHKEMRQKLVELKQLVAGIESRFGEKPIPRITINYSWWRAQLYARGAINEQ